MIPEKFTPIGTDIAPERGSAFEGMCLDTNAPLSERTVQSGPVVGKVVWDSHTDLPPEHAPIPTSRLNVVTDAATTVKEFTLANWTNNGRTDSAWTDNPGLLAAMLRSGPAGVQESLSGKHGRVDMRLVIPTMRARGKSIVEDVPKRELRIMIDPETGIMAMEMPKPAVTRVEDSDTPQAHVINDVATKPPVNGMVYVENGPDNMYGHSFPEALVSGEDEIPAFAAAWEALGVSGGKYSESTFTFPLPTEYKKRLDHLRETDASGVFYPEVELLPVARIDYDVFLHSYARGIHPIGTTSFNYFQHDSIGYHIRGLMTYGTPLMDMVSTYASLHTDSDPATIEIAAKRIDGITGVLGNNEFSTKEDEFLDEHFGGMLADLTAAGKVDELEIVQLLRSRGTLNDNEQITIELVRHGLVALAKERLGL